MSPSPAIPSDWLSLGPAARLVGVDPDTLRHWADDGRIEAFTTPGGHRRFARRALEQLVAARRPGRRPRLAALGATPERLSRAYRRSYATSRTTESRLPRQPTDPDRQAFRRDGRRLVEALLAHLDAPNAATRAATEGEATALVEDLARRLATRGTELTEAISLFVAARRPFLAELGAIGRRRALEAGRLTATYEEASALLDRLLISLVTTYQASADGPGRGALRSERRRA